MKSTISKQHYVSQEFIEVFPGIYDNIEHFLSQIWNNEYKNITGIDLFLPPYYTKGLYKIALKIQIGF